MYIIQPTYPAYIYILCVWPLYIYIYWRELQADRRITTSLYANPYSCSIHTHFLVRNTSTSDTIRLEFECDFPYCRMSKIPSYFSRFLCAVASPPMPISPPKNTRRRRRTCKENFFLVDGIVLLVAVNKPLTILCAIYWGKSPHIKVIFVQFYTPQFSGAALSDMYLDGKLSK